MICYFEEKSHVYAPVLCCMLNDVLSTQATGFSPRVHAAHMIILSFLNDKN